MLRCAELVLSGTNVLVAGALALFAYLTWKATRLYSRASALNLALQQLALTQKPTGSPEYRWAEDCLVAIFSDFPELRSYFQIPDNVAKRLSLKSSG